MAIAQLKNITINFPTVTPGEGRAFEQLSELVFGSTAFEPAADLYPRIAFESGAAGGVSVAFGDVREMSLQSPPDRAVPAASPRLPLEDVCRRFAGAIVEVDHVGINLSPHAVGGEAIETLLDELAATTNLYAYPGGHPWYFAIPSTEHEHASVLRDFSRVRRPKFEVVVDERGPTPVLQIDLATSLDRAEVEKRLPAPHGMELPGLADIFRTVFVSHPWSGFELRLDLRYAAERLNEWTSGEWLVTEGQRR